MNKKIKILVIAFFIICFFATISNAAIEIKPGSQVHKNITASDAYKYCYDLRINSNTSTLGDNKLDPHLSLNKDIGAVIYLSMSGYGKVRTNTKTFPNVSINENSYTTTNGNKTGVMNIDNSYTYTSCIFDGATSTNNIANLVTNKDTKYVESLSEYTIESTKGMGITEIDSWLGYAEPVSADKPACAFGRNGDAFFLYSSSLGLGSGTFRWLSGNSVRTTKAEATFRPVIWN